MTTLEILKQMQDCAARLYNLHELLCLQADEADMTDNAPLLEVLDGRLDIIRKGINDVETYSDDIRADYERKITTF